MCDLVKIPLWKGEARLSRTGHHGRFEKLLGRGWQKAKLYIDEAGVYVGFLRNL